MNDMPRKFKLRTIPKPEMKRRTETVELRAGEPQFVECCGCGKKLIHFDGNVTGRLIPLRPSYDCMVCQSRTKVKVVG